MPLNKTCDDCGRPIAGEDTKVDGVHCFKRFDPNGDERTDFEVTCLRLAVERLREPVLVKHAGPAGLLLGGRTPDFDRARIELAGRALQGILADASAGGVEHEDPVARFRVCRAAREYADQLLAELGYPVAQIFGEAANG